ncbi:MAG: hypothetical protein RL069_825, partial [Planctomycetota bacterium]
MKRVERLGVTKNASNPSKLYGHDVWLLDLALGLLGVLVLVLVARILRFDDP